MVRLSVIVVSYNVQDLLSSCLRSTFASAAHSAGWLSVDVHVVDNASDDGSAQMVAAEFPDVHLIASAENLGFAGGNNLALAQLSFAEPVCNPQSPHFVLLLNPDAEVVDDALGQMVTFLQEQPRVGACGAHLRYGDGRFQHGAFRFPSLLQVAFDLLPLAQVPGLRRFLPRLFHSRLNGRYPQSLWQGNKPITVVFVLGAALMVRGEAIRQVGVLDDGYFMYCEEMDWCLRLQQAGWPVYAVPAARVIHHEGQSSQQVRWASFERLWRSRFRFYRKHTAIYPPGYAVLLQEFVKLCLAVRGWLARRRFARGEISGVSLAEELSSYDRIIQER